MWARLAAHGESLYRDALATALAREAREQAVEAERLAQLEVDLERAIANGLVDRIIPIEAALEAWIDAHPGAWYGHNNGESELEFIYATISVPFSAVPCPTDPLAIELLDRRAGARGVGILLTDYQGRQRRDWFIIANPHSA